MSLPLAPCFALFGRNDVTEKGHMTMRIRVLSIAMFATCGAFGCAGEALDPEALGAAGAPLDHTAVDTAQQPLTAPGPPMLDYDEIRFPEDPADPNPGLPADQWVCGLGRMTGSMQSGDARVQIGANNLWTVTARSSPGAQRMNVTANCYRLGAFTGPVPGGQSDTTRWLSDSFWHELTSSSCPAFVIAANTWWGDAATFLTGIFGGMYGGGEQVSITQSNDPRAPSRIAARNCQGTLSMYARSLFIGDPSLGWQAKFIGPGGEGDATTSREYEVERSYVNMARRDQAFCYFTHIQGAFAGYGEVAEIYPATSPAGLPVWAMRTASGQGSLRARARCFMLNQSR
jgi:hypothetical protein